MIQNNRDLIQHLGISIYLRYHTLVARYARDRSDTCLHNTAAPVGLLDNTDGMPFLLVYIGYHDNTALSANHTSVAS